MTSTLRTLLALVMVATATQATADHWPQFRGSRFDGVVSSACPVHWDASRNVRWKVPIAGEGWSCPVVWGDQVFLTAAVRTDKGADGSSRPEPYRGGGGRRRTDLTEATYRWEVICLDAATGKLNWRQTPRSGSPPIPRHSSNSYATETPVTDGDRVYAYFGMTGLYCYDMTGELQWQKDLGTYRMRAGWGTSSSPVLFEGKLFLQVDNEEQSFLVALDAETGEELWRADRPEPSQYSSPIIWQNSQRSEVIAGGQICRSYDPTTGKQLWQLDMSKGRSSATPLAVGDRLYIGTELRNRGGSDDGGGFLFAVTPGGTGDITPAERASAGEFVEWRIEKSGIQMASPVLCDGHLYLLERRSSILHCVNAATGETAYRKRIPGARAFWASPWTCDGKVYCLADSGTTFVLKGGPEFEILAENVIEEQCWSTPAIVDGTIYLRTVDHLYCIADGSN
ncbi:outer membrane biogenesis protein BamB [Maioricimonas rarisocia]|uniref:Outer membrane biogenesis protein BamB n=1 Tax=Maioricimonas rarisocia TaxID=2528026 RepID=A0A517Z0V4_9PLAN|nr:PQQ-binding-like beta-propeller repeat protein [Maioricimonas rarisocia]QDU36116.1 outer membrane biogenesis protein BamB [Maioricimonas rarisocia]